MSWYSGFMALVGHMTGVVLEQLLSAYRREGAGVSLLERERERVLVCWIARGCKFAGFPDIRFGRRNRHFCGTFYWDL